MKNSCRARAGDLPVMFRLTSSIDPPKPIENGTDDQLGGGLLLPGRAIQHAGHGGGHDGTIDVFPSASDVLAEGIGVLVLGKQMGKLWLW